MECVAVRRAADGIKTFEFRAPKGLRYQPGMYVSFDLQVGGAKLGAPCRCCDGAMSECQSSAMPGSACGMNLAHVAFHEYALTPMTSSLRRSG